MELVHHQPSHSAVCELITTTGTLRVSMENEVFICDEFEAPLHTRPLTSRLLFHLIAAGNIGLCATQISRLIYGEASLENRSPRYRQAAKHRIIKLISRARRWLTDECSGVLPGQYKWLTYEPKDKRWHLVGSKMPMKEMIITVLH